MGVAHLGVHRDGEGALPAALTAKPIDGIVYDAGFAAATAAKIVATRISNLVVTLDKIKYVMRQPGQNRAPFSPTPVRRRGRGPPVGGHPQASGGHVREEGWRQAGLPFSGKGARNAGAEAKMSAAVGQREGDAMRFILGVLAKPPREFTLGRLRKPWRRARGRFVSSAPFTALWRICCSSTRGLRTGAPPRRTPGSNRLPCDWCRCPRTSWAGGIDGLRDANDGGDAEGTTDQIVQIPEGTVQIPA